MVTFPAVERCLQFTGTKLCCLLTGTGVWTTCPESLHSFDHQGVPWEPLAISPIPSLPHLLLYLLVYFNFPLFPYLLASLSSFIFCCFSIPSHSTRIVPLRFRAECRRRRLNLALVLCVLILCYMYFLVKDVCLFLLYLICFVLLCDTV